MGCNILVTGAAGYIGGSILNALIGTKAIIETAGVFAAYRSENQIEFFSKLPVKAIRLDVSDGKAVMEAVLANKIDILINATVSFVPEIIRGMIEALGEVRRTTGVPVFFIHSGFTNIFAPESGWPYGPVSDTDAIYAKEREWHTENPVQATDILVVEESALQDVTCVNVVVPNVYGRGSGPGRKLSVNIPQYIRLSIADKTVRKFDQDSSQSLTHISDLAALYVLLVEKYMQGASFPTGEGGYYFAVAHCAFWWAIMDAAEKLGFTRPFIRAMAVGTGQQIPVNAHRLGWQPEWDETAFWRNIDDEVQAVLDLDTVKPTIFQDNLNAKK